MNDMKKFGYSRYDLMKSLKYEGLSYDYNEILEYFNKLPLDNYAPDSNRYRTYSRAIILPGTEEIYWLPTINKEGFDYAAYFQGKFNPEHPDSYREFHAIDKKIRNNKLLNKIILHDYKETFWNEVDKILPIHVGVHFVKLYVKTADDEAISSPNSFHQDGEPFTFAHLIERKNILGGINAIAVPSAIGNTLENIDQNDLKEVFELQNPLESYGVYDRKVSHYVSPVKKGKDNLSGARSVILIDYQQTVVADINE
ncbi:MULTISPECIES: 2OG-Fe dioxygenase family protein [unclassified Staphylococcus]|uniref:2OG-Fe dioxygenase family protein n=1 Tax=unclassified Staphylococcus TaxID=91994 RepID=UPI0021CEC4FF|nr:MULTISPECIES: 2OG-Fe dioxygenase family protein [unclassified Staphylococcus]UXR78335.1 2OG-Fe dioxygenase family protein [Staphylococcus sp. IVB6227]UXR82500.1 2OG-Fe dioxygenase family protein [Staphylococcus sp. IVB6214]